MMELFPGVLLLIGVAACCAFCLVVLVCPRAFERGRSPDKAENAYRAPILVDREGVAYLPTREVKLKARCK